MNPSHKEILSLIKENSGTPTKHTHLDNYLGSDHFRYPINIPTLRLICKEWMRSNKDMSATDFVKVLTSLAKAESHTEKIVVGILLDNATADQRKFDPEVFDIWLDHLKGWAEVDSVCTGRYTITEVAAQWTKWKKLLIRFSKSGNIHKRRASIVLLCSPLRKPGNETLFDQALENIDRLKSEKEILITKAISWVLRSAIPTYKNAVRKYLAENSDTLPKIAVRETNVKLLTGRKGGKL